jgi:acyl carrier protein
MPMSSEEVLREVTQVFARVFERPDIVVGPETTASDVPGWDSLNHVALISEVQAHFKVKFGIKEVMRFRNVGDLCRLLEQKLQR